MASSKVAVVTGYVRLDNGYRCHADYVRLGNELLGLHSPTVAYLDRMDAPAGVTVRPASLWSCWLWPLAQQATPPAGNPAKDTREYHAVQHQKTAWLADAVSHTDADHLVWIDLGVFHNERIRPDHVTAFLAAVAERRPDRITLPSIWPLDSGEVLPWRVNWFLAGAVAIVPRHLASLWQTLCQRAATEFYTKTGGVTWEVNTWAAVAKARPDLVDTYQADHDETLFTGFR